MINANITCPAVILAVNRIASVNGREMCLINSITDKRGANNRRTPFGIKLLTKERHEKRKVDKKILVHIIRANGRVNIS
jgi:hypothetical protein